MTLPSPSFYEGRSTGQINLEAPLHVVLAALPKEVVCLFRGQHSRAETMVWNEALLSGSAFTDFLTRPLHAWPSFQASKSRLLFCSGSARNP